MAEQLTQVTGRLKQQNNAPFFLVNVEDIDAAEAFSCSSKYPDTSLLNFLKSYVTDLTYEDIEFDTSKIIINVEPNNSKTSMLGKAILGKMYLGK